MRHQPRPDLTHPQGRFDRCEAALSRGVRHGESLPLAAAPGLMHCYRGALVCFLLLPLPFNKRANALLSDRRDRARESARNLWRFVPQPSQAHRIHPQPRSRQLVVPSKRVVVCCLDCAVSHCMRRDCRPIMHAGR